MKLHYTGMIKEKEKFRMNLKDKLLWFTVKKLRTEQYIYEKKIEAIDYAIFLNNLTDLYIEARDHEEVSKLIKIQNTFIY